MLLDLMNQISAAQIWAGGEHELKSEVRGHLEGFLAA